MVRVRLPAFFGKIRGLPPRVVAVILLLVAINLVIWIVCGVVLHFYPHLIAPAVLSYTLGLRHALDADHIAAIDLMTRRLVAVGERPVTVGTFFSLGHSTVVIVTCLVVAATSGALRDRFEDFQRIGGIIGTSISAVFLLAMGAVNAWIMAKLIRRLKGVLARGPSPAEEGQGSGSETDESDVEGARDDGQAAPASDVENGEAPESRRRRRRGAHDATVQPLQLQGGGCMATIFRKVFVLVDRPWKMLPLGILFGLGFDTSSEIAILGIASLQGVQGTSIWLILLFPLLFTGTARLSRRSKIG